MTPEALRRRMAHGNIYPAEQIDAALGNYFRDGQPGRTAGARAALARPTGSMRHSTSTAGCTASSAPGRRGSAWSWRSPGPGDGDRLVRRAARMAQRTKGDLIAVHVRPQDGLAAPAVEMLDRQRALVERLGGAYREVVGDDVGDALVSTARTLNATQIVLGATRRSRWRELTSGSVIATVIRGSGEDIDVHVISRALDAEADRPHRRRPSALPRRRVTAGAVVAVALLPVLTAVLAELRGELGLPTVLLLYLLAVVVISAVGGLIPAVLAAVAAFLLANWYFTPPLYEFTIGEAENLIALAVFLAVATLVSAFVSLAARRAAEGTRARSEAEALSRLAGSASVQDVLEAIRRTFALEGVTLWHGHDGEWTTSQSAGVEADRGPSSVQVDATHELALAGRPVPADEQRVLAAFAAELASSLHVEELEAEASELDELERASDLRTAILSAVSHDLRTPISGIKASVTSLLSRDVEWPAEESRAFLEAIDEETDRLNGLVGNLLDMSRLQTGALEIDTTAVGLEEVVPAALRSLGAVAAHVEAAVPETLPRVVADPGLLERAIANVVANAVSHTPPGTEVHLDAGAFDEHVDLRVVDRGPGIPRGQCERIFQPFQRLGDSPQDGGVGLGLAVAKGFVEAMNGEIEVEDTPGGGLTVVLRLRAAQ